MSAPSLKLEVSTEGVMVLTPSLPERLDEDEAITAQQDLLGAFLENEDRTSLVFWYYTPAALSFSAAFTPDITVYDCMDELSAFKMAPTSLRLYERELFKRADVVFTGGHSLYQAKKNEHHNVHAFPSSVDTMHFAKGRKRGPCPGDLAQFGRPRLGFFGVIDERMDLDMIAAMADARPGWQFVMIGPVVKIDPASLPQRNNVHWIGRRDYSVLPDYIGSWDVGLMPFALNESTRFISPTKTPEFLAAGCPVVSTAIADVVTPYGVRGLVEIVSSAAEAVACAERLMQRDRIEWLNAVDEQLSGTSWDQTWMQMDAQIRACSRKSAIRSDDLVMGAARV